MTPAGFESAVPANERPQTHVLDRVTTGMEKFLHVIHDNLNIFSRNKYLLTAATVDHHFNNYEN